MRVEFTWSVVPAMPDLLGAVQRGDADVAIDAITMTTERDNRGECVADRVQARDHHDGGRSRRGDGGPGWAKR